MKIRQGFVSNSSSSSFIIGVGKIKDRASLKKLLPESNYDTRFNILSTTALLENCDGYSSYRVKGDRLTITAPVNSEPEISIGFDPSGDDDYFIVEVGNNEGDSSFPSDQCGYLDYDCVDENWFGGKQKKLLEILKNKDLFHEVEYKIGADRNG